MKWSVDEFVLYLKTLPTSELEVFKRQTTVYAVFILLEALATGEASFRDGILTLDDVQYDCKDHLPVTAVQTYGFGIGGELAYDEVVGRGILGLLESIYLLRAESLVEELEESFTEICATGPAVWNYYGAYLAHESELPLAWSERAAALFASSPVPVPVSGPAPVSAPAPVPTSTTEVLPTEPVVKPSRFFSKGHTRRMHGKRALSPIRRTRGTATTRRRNQKHTNTT